MFCDSFPSRNSSSPSDAASALIVRSAGCASKRSPARFTSFNFRLASKAKIATSISSITLRNNVAERVLALRPPRANRIVPFAHRFQQIRDGPQRERDPLPHRRRESDPAPQDQYGQSPLDLRRVISGPPQNDQDRDDGRQPCPERQQQNPSFMHRLEP